MSARERILKKIQQALSKETDKPIPQPDFSKPVFKDSEETHIEVIFAENFRQNEGEFFFCESLEDFLVNLKKWLELRGKHFVFVWEKYLQDLLNVAQIPFYVDDEQFLKAEMGISLCEALVARTGSIIISSQQTAGRRLGIYPPIHIVVAFTSQIFYDLDEALPFLQDTYAENFPSMLSVISGPSRTADIEKTLVLGAHGPKELTLFLIDE